MSDPLSECRGADGELDMEKVKTWEQHLKELQASHSDELDIIATNLLAVQVCVRRDLTAQRIEELTNLVYPCGTTNGWGINGDIPSVVCSNDSGRLHYVLWC